MTSTPCNRPLAELVDQSDQYSNEAESLDGNELVPVYDDSCLGPNAHFLTGRPGRILDSSDEWSTASTDDSFRTVRENSGDVDDTTLVEAINISDAKRHLSTNTPVATSKARYSELVAGTMMERAAEIGMKMNCKKTQLLLISPPNGYDNHAYLKLGEERIGSLKIAWICLWPRAKCQRTYKRNQEKVQGKVLVAGAFAQVWLCRTQIDGAFQHFYQANN